MLTFGEIDLAFGESSNDVKLVGYPAVEDYLRKRGITSADMDTLDLRIVPAQQLKQMTLRHHGMLRADDRLAVVIPHFDFENKHIDWWSARMVQTVPMLATSFAHVVGGPKGKMICPPNEPPRAYLPPITQWKFTKGARVYIHESAIKAINGAKAGGLHVGLNGVWGWTSRHHDISLISELRAIPWRQKELTPVIVFDSNWDDNDQVRLAIARLGAKIQELTGQIAIHLPVPRTPDGRHQGFDDYAVALASRDRVLEFLAGEGQPIALGELEIMKLKLNTEVCVVRSLGRIAEQETGTLMARGTFTDVNYAHYMAQVEDGENIKFVNVPRLWLADSRRVEVDTLTYMPGSDRLCGGSLNLWRGMGLEPQAGDVSRWLELLTRNVTDHALRKWVIQWMAYPLQHLGAKMNSYIHLFGPPGSGKQALIAPLMRIYGADNSIVIGKDQIQSSFNSVYANKQFVNIDELHGGADLLGVAVANRIKMLVTGERMVVNTKGQPEYSVPNCANVVSTANYSDAIRLDDDDRRAAVVRFGERGNKHPREYWEEYFHWIEGEGAAIVYDYLLTVDLTGFDPKGWAPMTEDKVEVTRATRRVDEQWVAQLWDDPSQVLPPILKSRCLMTGDELAQYCYGEDPAGVTPGKRNALGIRMHSAGFPRIELKVDGRKVRYWIIRKRDEVWTTDRARDHVKAHGLPSK